jgi:ribonuclease HI
MKTVLLYTDGACSRNGSPDAQGGWAFILATPEKEILHEESGLEEGVTNSRMEMQAVFEGLCHLEDPHIIHLYSDSEFVVRGINEWLPKWIDKRFKGVKNSDLWEKIANRLSFHNVTAIHVRGHNGHLLNERADLLAVRASNGIFT